MDFDKQMLRPPDDEVLRELVQQVAHSGMMVADIGSWKGYSTSILAKVVGRYHGKVFAVDHWRGSPNAGDFTWEMAKQKDVYSIFRQNMVETGLWEAIHPLVMDSQTAAEIFRDSILDLVFIDGDHRYEYAKRDILGWLPKLRRGGIICGHDCEDYYRKYPEEIRRLIDKATAVDTEIEWEYVHGMHTGVIKALYDCFHDEYSRAGARIWRKVK